MAYLIDVVNSVIQMALDQKRHDLVVYMRTDQIQNLDGIRKVDWFQVVPTINPRWRAIVAQDSTQWVCCIGDSGRDIHIYEDGIPEAERIAPAGAGGDMSDTAVSNRALAERAGYRVAHGRDRGWFLLDPAGAWAVTYMGAPVCWHEANLAWDGAPDYLHSADAALTLAAQVPGTFVLTSAADGIWQAWFGTPSVPQATAGTPAEAVCRAWWKWMETQED